MLYMVHVFRGRGGGLSTSGPARPSATESISFRTLPTADLIVSDLRKEYPTPTTPLVVLKGMNLKLSPGERLAIVGPSGSGKSTLLNILGTLDTPSGGSVRVGEVDPFALDAKALAAFRSRSIGFVFQDHHLLPQCTALE